MLFCENVMNEILFQLIQVAIGNRKELTSLRHGSGQAPLSAEEWAQLRLEFKKQALLGIGYVGITRLPQAQCPPIQVLAQWVHNSEKIRKKNERLNALCVQVAEDFRKDGFDCCVLKGQSNLVNYQTDVWVDKNPFDKAQDRLQNPLDESDTSCMSANSDSPIVSKLPSDSQNHQTVLYQNSDSSKVDKPSASPKKPNYLPSLAEYRTPGDIDIWVRPRSVSGRPVRDVVEYVKRVRCGRGLTDEEEIRYHHIDMCGVYDCEVEVHFRPQFLDVPWRNRRFQRWCEEQQGVCAVRYCPPGSSSARAVSEGVAPGYERFACTGFQPERSFPIPTNSFNAVYQLVHMQRHLMDEGIGLRQLLDYYFVLRALHIEQGELGINPVSGFSVSEVSDPDHRQSMGMWAESIGRGVMSNVEIMHQLKRFGLGKFASAVMWVLQEAFDPIELSTGDPQNPDQNPTDGSILREPQDRRQLTTRNQTENNRGSNYKGSSFLRHSSKSTENPTDGFDKLTTRNPNKNLKPWMLCPPDEKAGRFLLEEIMRSGNFGHDDTRFAKAKDGLLAHASLRLNSG